MNNTFGENIGIWAIVISVSFMLFFLGYEFRKYVDKNIIDCYTKNHGEYIINHDICIVSNKYKIIEVK